MRGEITIICGICNKETVGYRVCTEEYTFDIDGWDGVVEFHEHKQKYCNKPSNTVSMED